MGATILLLFGYHDAGSGHAIALNHGIKLCRVLWQKPHTPMAGRAAQLAHMFRAVNGIAAVEKHRIGHGRIVIFAGKINPRHAHGTEGPARCVETLAPRGHNPIPISRPIHIQAHVLGADVNMGNHYGWHRLVHQFAVMPLVVVALVLIVLAIMPKMIALVKVVHLGINISR